MTSKCDKIIFWKETSKKRRQEKLLVILLSQPQEPGMFDGDRKNIREHKKSLVMIVTLTSVKACKGGLKLVDNHDSPLCRVKLRLLLNSAGV